VSPPSASWASPPTLRRASAAPTSCANSPAAGMWRSRRAPSRASHPSGTTAAGQLPLRDRSRRRRPRTVLGARAAFLPRRRAAGRRIAPDLAQEWGCGGRHRPAAVDVNPRRDRRPHGVDPGLGCRHLMDARLRRRRPPAVRSVASVSVPAMVGSSSPSWAIVFGITVSNVTTSAPSPFWGEMTGVRHANGRLPARAGARCRGAARPGRDRDRDRARALPTARCACRNPTRRSRPASWRCMRAAATAGRGGSASAPPCARRRRAVADRGAETRRLRAGDARDAGVRVQPAARRCFTTSKPTEKVPAPAVVATNGKSETLPRELAGTH
jgi:hypothetical protein